MSRSSPREGPGSDRGTGRYLGWDWDGIRGSDFGMGLNMGFGIVRRGRYMIRYRKKLKRMGSRIGLGKGFEVAGRGCRMRYNVE